MTASVEKPSRRAALGAMASVPALAILPAAAGGTLTAVPAGPSAADFEPEPELRALIARWHEAHRRLDETYEAYNAADDRADCPVPQALIATEGDAGHWCHATAGERYDESDVAQLRGWMALLSRPKGPFPHQILPSSEMDDRANEIITSWDNWQAEQRAAQEREGVAEAEALWDQAVKNYHATGQRVAKLKAKTMIGVLAKLLAAAPHITGEELENVAHTAVLAGAALDAATLAGIPLLV